ncbi:hypothetical protein ElyMa_004582500 [Elysia marginata]|uniref:Uncharacterized protein n=1 Tax=Elysia marginata TaxID=1093978 RepID=A0AAV4HXR8_9GAST|nr:hypothetical protein ElyMa_004582500 [Elysia marginata]
MGFDELLFVTSSIVLCIVTKTGSSVLNGRRIEGVPRWRPQNKEYHGNRASLIVWTGYLSGLIGSKVLASVILLAPIEATACGNHMAGLPELFHGIIFCCLVF